MRSSKSLVWIGSVVLAVAFLFTGLGKLASSADQLHDSAHGIPVLLLRVAGATEVLGAIGLLVPAATRIMPVLTPLAAAALAAQMAAATATNLVIRQVGSAAITLILAALALTLAWARTAVRPVRPRSAPRHPTVTAGTARP
jgi:uncharacterized membrane protein YphA (DoxX/SURF4 family)